MSGSTFRELLKQSSATIERPRALAAGHYSGTIKSFEFGRSSKKQTPFVRLFFTPEEAANDVDPVEIEGIDFSKKELRKEYYITPQSLYRLSDMLDAVLGTDSRSFDDRIPELRGARVVFAVTKRESETNEGEFFNDVGTVVSADA
jgi:hypothetical protein